MVLIEVSKIHVFLSDFGSGPLVHKNVVQVRCGFTDVKFLEIRVCLGFKKSKRLIPAFDSGSVEHPVSYKYCAF